MTVIEAGAAEGRKIASWLSLKTDLRNAGAECEDSECVVDGNLVSSRKPDDIPAFNRAMLELFSQGKQKSIAPSTTGAENPQHHVEKLKKMLNAWPVTPAKMLGRFRTQRPKLPSRQPPRV